MSDTLFLLVEQLTGYFLLIAGLSLLLQNSAWVVFVKKMVALDEENLNSICLMACVIFAPFGLAIVLTHNDWTMSWSVIVTIVGWLGLIKNTFLALFPHLGTKCIYWIYRKDTAFLKKYFMSCGFIYFVLGVLVLSNHWMFY